MPSAIHCQALTRHFGAVRALDALTLDVPRGSIFAFLGPNGAGKTTTIHLLLGLIEPTSGSARVLGLDPVTDGAEIRRHSGALLEHAGLYERLSAEDNLRFYARIAHLSEEEAAARSGELLARFGLHERRHDPVATWSRGMKQKLAIARVLLHRPSLVFLDEPTAGLDPEAVVALRRDIVALGESDGATVFLTTHNLADVERMATHVAVIQSGRLLDFGTPAELRRRAIRSRVLVRTESGQLAFELPPGERVAPLVTRLVEEGAQIEEVRREEPSLEEVFLQLVRDGGGNAPAVPSGEPMTPPPRRAPRPMFGDIAAVIRKEWRELTSPAGSGMSRRATTIAVALLLLVMAGLAAFIGPAFTKMPVAFAISMVSMIVLLATVSDSFAGERERHTLETLLASAIPDEALLFGKMLASVVYGWTATVVILVVMLAGANVPLREPFHGFAFYQPSTLMGALLLAPLMMLLISAAGVLLSLRAATVREASARLTIAMFGAVIPFVAVRPFLPESWKLRAVALLRTESGRLQVLATNLVILLLLDAVLVALAVIRFRRSRLLAR